MEEPGQGGEGWGGDLTFLRHHFQEQHSSSRTATSTTGIKRSKFQSKSVLSFAGLLIALETGTAACFVSFVLACFVSLVSACFVSFVLACFGSACFGSACFGLACFVSTGTRPGSSCCSWLGMEPLLLPLNASPCGR